VVAHYYGGSIYFSLFFLIIRAEPVRVVYVIFNFSYQTTDTCRHNSRVQEETDINHKSPVRIMAFGIFLTGCKHYENSVR